MGSGRSGERSRGLEEPEGSKSQRAVDLMDLER